MATSLAASAAADGMANSSLDAMQKQLLEATEQLERERKQSQSQIAALQSQISELSADAAQTRESQAGSQSEGDGNSQRVEPAATGDGELARRGKEVAELEARLAKAEQEHAQELAAAQDAQKETLLALEQRLAETESLQSHLDLKASELSSLNARLDKSAADLARMTRMYEELVAEREQEQEQQQQRREDGLSEESEMVASLKKQMEKLRRDFVDAEEQRQVLFNRLEAATVARSEAESRLSTVVPDLEQLRLKTGDYEEKCAVLSQCRECLGEIVALARKKSSDSDVDADSAGRAGAEPTGPLDPLELLSLSKHLVLQLVERVAALGQHSAEMSNDIEAKGTRISELERELEEARRLSERDAAQGEHAEKQSDSAGGALGNVQSRIEELERVNSELIEERNQFIQDQVVFNDYLEKLESESNRLVEDIEQLTVENQRLTEELRMASLHNSTVSLDVAAIDSKLAGELAEDERDEQPAQTKPSSEGGGNAATKTEAEVDADALQHKHQREIGLMQIRISELEQRKNTEIKRLQDEIGTLEDLVEDKIFSESELNDKIASLSSEVDRLQREIKHLRGSETSSGKTYTSAENGIDTLLKPTNAFAVNGSPLDRLTTNAGIAEESASSLSATNLVISGKHDGIDNDDDESVYCDICDVSTHRISDCPEISATSNIFKQEVPIDSSRPYCDNCELFDHWTDECPHGDEMF
ncbi:hypothetical protein LPJ56_004443 [Coemansia sp. RSA 2599]|nr:hypothetical protein LPJ56_004443 [Coemansia sp. RSA 2599]